MLTVMPDDGSGRYSIDLLPPGDGAGATLTVAGEFDMAPADELLDRVAALRDARTPVTVDLRGLTFLDSYGTCTLLRLAQDGAREQWDVRMVPPTGRAWRVVELCDVADHLPWTATG